MIERYPLNLDRVVIKSNYDVKPNQIRLVSVGRIEEERAQYLIIKACQPLSENCSLKGSSRSHWFRYTCQGRSSLQQIIYR